jgi:hypothetical protein
MGRQFEKSKAETYPDVTRFTQQAPEPKDEQDADAHTAANYAASCENACDNFNHDAAAKGSDTRKNIKQIAEGM